MLHLLKQLQGIESGCLFDIVVVCNANSSGNIPDLPQLDSQKVKYLMRENTGFNIGAWDYGWRHLPPYDYYLFLQDDCFIVRPLWLKAFVDRFRQSPQIGLLGEGLNWECTWEELVRSS